MSAPVAPLTIRTRDAVPALVVKAKSAMPSPSKSPTAERIAPVKPANGWNERPVSARLPSLPRA